jgi:hypothetical protein
VNAERLKIPLAVAAETRLGTKGPNKKEGKKAV